jgi:hypothetical protein
MDNNPKSRLEARVDKLQHARPDHEVFVRTVIASAVLFVLPLVGMIFPSVARLDLFEHVAIDIRTASWKQLKEHFGEADSGKLPNVRAFVGAVEETYKLDHPTPVRQEPCDDELFKATRGLDDGILASGRQEDVLQRPFPRRLRIENWPRRKTTASSWLSSEQLASPRRS